MIDAKLKIVSREGIDEEDTFTGTGKDLGADIGGGSLENLINHEKVVHLKVGEKILLEGSEYLLQELLSDSNDRRSYQLVDRDKNYKTLKIMQFFRPEKAIEAREKLRERLVKTNTAIGTNYKLISLNPLDVAILSDYVEGVDLQKSIFSTQKAFSQDKTIDCLLQLLNYRVNPLHQGGIVHRDIKPSNIILNESGGNIKYDLIDVGSSREIGTGLTTGGIESGTLCYTKFSSIHEPTDDFYSLARTAYFLLTGKEPAFSPNKKLDKMADEQNYSSIPVNKKFRKILFKMAGHKDKYNNCEELINDLLALKGIVSIEKAKGEAVKTENLEGTVSNFTVAYEVGKDILKLGQNILKIGTGIGGIFIALPSTTVYVKDKYDEAFIPLSMVGGMIDFAVITVSLGRGFEINNSLLKYVGGGLLLTNALSGIYEYAKYKKKKIIEERKMLPVIKR